MLLSLKKTKKPKQTIKNKNKTNKQQQYKQNQQQLIIAPVYLTGGDANRQLL